MHRFGRSLETGPRAELGKWSVNHDSQRAFPETLVGALGFNGQLSQQVPQQIHHRPQLSVVRIDAVVKLPPLKLRSEETVPRQPREFAREIGRVNVKNLG